MRILRQLNYVLKFNNLVNKKRVEKRKKKKVEIPAMGETVGIKNMSLGQLESYALT